MLLMMAYLCCMVIVWLMGHIDRMDEPILLYYPYKWGTRMERDLCSNFGFLSLIVWFWLKRVSRMAKLRPIKAMFVWGKSREGKGNGFSSLVWLEKNVKGINEILRETISSICMNFTNFTFLTFHPNS